MPQPNPNTNHNPKELQEDMRQLGLKKQIEIEEEISVLKKQLEEVKEKGKVALARVEQQSATKEKLMQREYDGMQPELPNPKPKPNPNPNPRYEARV